MSDPRDKKYTTVINVPCSGTDKAMAQQLAADLGSPMSRIIRQGIQTLHKMRFTNQPHCATGEPCKCAHMHVLRQAGEPTDEERVQAAHAQQESREPS